ncbi:TraM recognition domain-containing protein [Nocardia otitidiscaviarum]|uniref:type IV secretory system conjugative DNA transfer family protein n=1 Tax=Nocardia otitidiscaviarum TaxID=1823 RepID=UPI0020CDA601|nr:TraM recognition domain-containing protein [Nocardia otitidiscaviarum]MCP9625249.1 TraM recognition domain-containing protein [Nocardia otitidiscaviarum]
MDRSVKAPGAERMPGEWHEVAGVAGVAVGVPALVEVAGLAVWTAPLFGGPKQDVPLGNPVGLGWHLFATNELVWSGAAWGGLATVLTGTAATVAGTAVVSRWTAQKCRQWREERRRARAGKSRARVVESQPIDAQARYLARGVELTDLTAGEAAAKARELGIRLAKGDAPGISIGESVLDPQMLYGSYEDLHVDIMGPRAGKTTSRVIPAIMEALGAVVATSNKRDVVDATRGPRARMGTVRVFDPQQIAGEAPTWYWDPIAWVGADGGAHAEVRAAQLAGHFAAGGEADARDAFFDPEGEDLLAGLILAASVAKKPITQVYRWVTAPGDEEPIEILTEHGAALAAAGLVDQYNAPSKQRSGIFATAKKMAACLRYSHVHPWVTPPADGEAEREAFDVAAFVQSRDTLYPLSKEGKGSAEPLLTALTVAVVEAATAESERHGGRLPVPMLVCLDEAANIVKWPLLPKLYSHFGSRGILVMTILQSWAQGVRCWGADGMKALWTAANVKVVGRGQSDAEFLRDVSELAGDHYEIVSSTSQSRGREARSATTSTSWQRTTERTLTASDLGAIPKERALVTVSGHRPVMVRLIPWWKRPYAEQVAASLAQFDPASQRNAQVDGWSAPPSPADQEEGDR